MTYYVTADSFGSEVPSNWEEIAAFLNSITDERGIAEDHDACNELWEAYWNGELDGAPEAQTGTTMREEIEALANEIKASDTWDNDKLAKLCEYAGLSEEWEEADGDTFEQVAYKAAEILGVEII